MDKIAVYETLFTDGKPGIVKESEMECAFEGPYDHPKKLVKMLCELFNMHRATEEHMYLLCLNERCHVIGVFHLAHGSINACVTSMREVFMKALLTGCSSIIIVHNHPSGIPDPSENDTQFTKQLMQAGTIMSIPLLDHLIIGNEDKYFSFNESGALSNLQ